MSLLDVKVVREDWLKSLFYFILFKFFLLFLKMLFYCFFLTIDLFLETNKQIHCQVKTLETKQIKSLEAEYESPDLPFFNLNKTDFIQMVHVSVSTRLS